MITFTNHAQGKFLFFKQHGIIITKKQVQDVVELGKITDVSDWPVVESTGEFNVNHSLVVIYREENKRVIVITFWISRKGRYESKLQ